jgi:hypothetical protein
LVIFGNRQFSLCIANFESCFGVLLNNYREDFMSDPKSKLLARFDTTANATNRRPAVVGSFALATDGLPRSFRAWSGIGENGKSYLRGTHEPEKLTSAVKARHAEVVSAEGPPNIKLEPGELVLFENTGVAENAKRPTWYGYARTQEGYVRLSGWDKEGDKGTKLLAGTAEPYRPSETLERRMEQDGPGRHGRD